ncbi:MAG: hypothetical protein M3R61_10460 [Chloroflexota bacterium]|nr:hypothetical protein [Chloroflexota bacterium]
MARQDLFTMRVTPEERQLIARLAEQEQRSAADTIRLLVRQAVQKNERAPSRQEVSAPVRVTVPS